MGNQMKTIPKNQAQLEGKKNNCLSIFQKWKSIFFPLKKQKEKEVQIG